MESNAKARPAMSEAARKMQSARTALVMDQPFFGVLALRLHMREDLTCPTVWVDGRTLGFNPAFVDKLTHEQAKALLAHEVMHCAAGHPWRRDGRDMKNWNIATDRAINPIIASAGFALPAGGVPGEPGDVGKSSEWIFDRIPVREDEEGGDCGGGKSGNGHGDPNFGEVRDAPPDDEGEDGDGEGTSETDWKAAVQQAAKAAQAMGQGSAQLERFAGAARRSRVDWRSVTQRFAQEVTMADYAWQRPSTRYLCRGLYLPSMRSEGMGSMVVGIDTSGSIDEVMLAHFTEQVRAIVQEVQPRELHVVYADAGVNRHDVFARGDEIEFHHVGGGGTDFRPLFDLVAGLDETPACVLYLTDLEGRFPERDPGIPTLWVATPNAHCTEAPFGEVVTCDA